MEKAFIISGGELIATVKTNLKNGTAIEYSYSKCKEAINADREFNLVNAQSGKISRAKKYMKDYNYCENWATEINPGEFFVQSFN